MMTAYEKLAAHIAEYNDLLNILNTLKWDMRTQMPAGGAATRGSQLATLSKLAKQIFASDETARLLDAAEAEIAGTDRDAYQLRAVQQTREAYRNPEAHPGRTGWAAGCIGTGVRGGLGKSQRRGHDYAAFKPYLRQMLEYQHRISGGDRLRGAPL